jgi:hypothetical protein
MARHRTANADSGSSRTQLIHPSPFRRRESSLSSSEGAQPPLRPLHLRHHNAARDLSRAAAPQLSGRGRSQRTANGRRQRRRRSSAIGPACHRRRTRAARNRGRPHDQLRTRYQSFAATAGGSGRRERQAGQRRRVDRPPAWGVAEDAAILQGHKHEAGSVARVPALEIERRVAEAARAASSVYDRQRSIGWQSGPGGAIGPCAPSDLPARLRAIGHDANLRTAVERVVISRTTIEIELAEGTAGDNQNRILIIPWTPPSPYRRREIVQGEGERPSTMRPMRTKARAVLIDALRDAQRWLDELTTKSDQTIEVLAAREGRTERSIRMTLSLAFLCPALARAAIDGRLPRGFGVKRLMDLPMAWSDQWSALGLKDPAQATFSSAI